MTRMDTIKKHVMCHMVADALFQFDRPSEDWSEEQDDEWFNETWTKMLLVNLQYVDCTIEEMGELMEYFAKPVK
jgi:hypothetical protein